MIIAAERGKNANANAIIEMKCKDEDEKWRGKCEPLIDTKYASNMQFKVIMDLFNRLKWNLKCTFYESNHDCNQFLFCCCWNLFLSFVLCETSFFSRIVCIWVILLFKAHQSLIGTQRFDHLCVCVSCAIKSKNLSHHKCVHTSVFTKGQITSK